MSNRRDKYHPYHINFDKLLGNQFFDRNYEDCFHKHDISGIIRIIYKEPFAFYLTEDDKKYYTDKDLNALNVVTDIAISQINQLRNEPENCALEI